MNDSLLAYGAVIEKRHRKYVQSGRSNDLVHSSCLQNEGASDYKCASSTQEGALIVTSLREFEIGSVGCQYCDRHLSTGRERAVPRVTGLLG